MKIAVSSEGPDLDCNVDQRFGRCAHVLLVETDNMSFEALKNPYTNKTGGAGSRLAGLVASRGVKLVLTGSLGPHAQQALDTAGICTVLNNSGTVRQAVEAYVTIPRVSNEKESSAAIPPATVAGGGHGGGRGQGRRRRGGRGGWDEHGFYL